MKPGIFATERVLGANATCCVGRKNTLRRPRHFTVSACVELSANLETLKCNEIITFFGVFPTEKLIDGKLSTRRDNYFPYF